MTCKIELKTVEELNRMHTGSLMSRRAALLKCEESFELSDRNRYKTKPKISETGFIEFKGTTEWQQAYNELKSVLSTRENIPNKQECKEIRKEKAKNSK